VLARYPLPADNPFVNQFFNLFIGSRQQPGPLFEFVTRQCWQTDQGVMAHRFDLVSGSWTLAGRLDRVKVPALLLAGQRDLLVSEQGLDELAHGIARARAVRLPGCGHLAFATHPERVAAEVTRFLR
jgi:pimeloyl-ACP methyl ester carboxylesterase